MMTLLCFGAAPVAVSIAGAMPTRQAQVVASNLRSDSNAGEALVSIDVTNAALSNVLSEIVRKAGLRPILVKDRTLLARTVTMHVRNVPVTNAFAVALEGTGVTATISSGYVAFVEGNGSAQVNGSITGTVVDAKTKQPIEEAMILLDGAKKGVTTGRTGAFRLSNVPVGNHVLHIRKVGYSKRTESVTVTDGDPVTLSVALEQSVNALDQVVVTGTVIPTEVRALPNAITIITAKELEQRNITHIDQLFRGDVPGLFAMNTGSQATLGAVTMYSRGATALTPNSAGTDGRTNPIKTYIDGVEMADPQYLSQIDPRTIERIEVVTGPQASTIYGSNAINGVMQIFTKRGTTSRPQLVLNFQQSWVQNDFSPALAPGHVFTTQIDGLEGHIGYSVNGSVDYSPRWTPSNQTTRLSAGGGARYEGTSPIGRVTADFSVRRQHTANRDRGDIGETKTKLQADGNLYHDRGVGLKLNYDLGLTGETYEFTAGLAPTSWWSQTMTVGQDREDTQFLMASPLYSRPRDTTLFLSPTQSVRRSAKFSTTVRIPASSFAVANVTIGADGWQSLNSRGGFSSSSPTLSGQDLRGTYNQTSSHDAGGYLNSQIGLFEQVYFTYGLRAEWNPAYGKEIQPNLAPQYGITYNLERGNFTSHFRGTYGQATRPPALAIKRAVSFFGETCPTCFSDPFYSNFAPFNYQLANPNLEPEHQKGVEGGVDVAWSSLFLLSVTHYNQVVSNLIDNVYGVDSVRSLKPDASGYCQYGPSYCYPDGYGKVLQSQYNNVASLRNQGWELQGTITTGPFTSGGTYTWSKSRVIGVTDQLRKLFPLYAYGAYTPGSTPSGVREHTWLVKTSYARSSLSVILTVNGVERMYSSLNEFALNNFNRRLFVQENAIFIGSAYTGVIPGYAMANLNAARRIGSRADLTLQVQNLTNKYVNDAVSSWAEMGRQTSLGLRIRL